MKRTDLIRNNRKQYSFVGCVAMLLLLATMGCSGSGGSAAAQWEPAALSLPPGIRYATYDRAQDVIWILTWERGTEVGAMLTSFEPLSGDSRTYDIAVPSARLGVGAGLAVDDAGMVWAAWGNNLIALDPGTGRFQEWTIPDPDPADVQSVGDGLDGYAVDMALDVDGQAWIAIHSVKAVQVFNPDNDSWRSVSTAPMVSVDTSKLSVSSDGTIFLNGVVGQGYSPSLTRIEPQAGTARLTQDAPLAYALQRDGSLAYLRASAEFGAVEIVSDSKQVDANAAVRFDGVPAPLVSVAADSQGGFWFWHRGIRNLDIVRVDVLSGETVTFPYPLELSSRGADSGGATAPGNFWGPEVPEGVARDPGIQAIVIDNRDDVWVISDDGSNPPVSQQVYPPLYRLHVAQE